MSVRCNRREVLKALAAASTAIIVPPAKAQQEAQGPSARPIELQIASVSPHTIRLSVVPLENGSPGKIPLDGSLVQESWGEPIARLRSEPENPIVAGDCHLKISFHPVTIAIKDLRGTLIQEFSLDQNTGVLSFLLGLSPLYGLGEGGPQFDRRGSVDSMRSGQGGYKLTTHGGRVPIPWIIGTSGWAIFFHQPHGTFDLSGPDGKFQPVNDAVALPLDLFFVSSPDPATIPGRVCAHHRPPGDAAALEFRLSAVASHASQPRGSARGSENFSRKEIALRRADLSGHRFLSLRLEHRERLVRLEFSGISRSQGNARRTAQRSFSRRGAIL